MGRIPAAPVALICAECGRGWASPFYKRFQVTCSTECRLKKLKAQPHPGRLPSSLGIYARLKVDVGFKATYSVWKNMVQRCRNPKNNHYHRYGGRGIAVCERWKSFSLFFEDMGVRPEGLTLERIDNDGNYKPENCKWATWEEQYANRTPTQPRIFVPYGGKMYSLRDLEETFNIGGQTVYGRFLEGYREDLMLFGYPSRKLAKMWPYPADTQVERVEFINRWRKLGMTLGQLGQLLGLTRERIRQLETWEFRERKLPEVKINNSVFPAAVGRPAIRLPCAYCDSQFPKTKLLQHMLGCDRRS